MMLLEWENTFGYNDQTSNKEIENDDSKQIRHITYIHIAYTIYSM